MPFVTSSFLFLVVRPGATRIEGGGPPIPLHPATPDRGVEANDGSWHDRVPAWSKLAWQAGSWGGWSCSYGVEKEGTW